MHTILLIQSAVAYGHVGNSSAVFPMQRRGNDVWPVHTVMFSNHTGYGAWRGPLLAASDIAAETQKAWTEADGVTGVLPIGVVQGRAEITAPAGAQSAGAQSAGATGVALVGLPREDSAGRAPRRSWGCPPRRRSATAPSCCAAPMCPPRRLTSAWPSCRISTASSVATGPRPAAWPASE